MDFPGSSMGGTGEAAGAGHDHGMGGMHEMMGGGMGGMMGAGMAVGMVLWWLVGLAVLVLAVVGIVWLVRRTGTDAGSPAAQREVAEDLLRRRYAAGEIDDEEFHRRMAVLSDRRS